jgi:hypothetical protein
LSRLYYLILAVIGVSCQGTAACPGDPNTICKNSLCVCTDDFVEKANVCKKRNYVLFHCIVMYLDFVYWRIVFKECAVICRTKLHQKDGFTNLRMYYYSQCLLYFVHVVILWIIILHKRIADDMRQNGHALHVKINFMFLYEETTIKTTVGVTLSNVLIRDIL